MKNAPRIDRYGQLSTIGTEDARTIHSAFSNFDPEAKETYTAESARRVAELLCMWTDPQLKKSPADSSQDTNRSSADMDVSEIAIGTASARKRYRLTRYDPTLISHYVLPRLGDVDERLHESIHNAGKRLAIKSDLARQARKPDAAKDLSRAARLFKALDQSILGRLTRESIEATLSDLPVSDLPTTLPQLSGTQET
ncbi:hypothetical protein QFC20_000836 [Naganishia adeliensis]|uniref:Uncharacterized protein n=1 Tax=Naganishia adeliensis TaxID=92952 RepID=A0ACC2WZB5_9TREE|nr:hypothetical protein QFC20_000836 [Naganishia adeliensis]